MPQARAAVDARRPGARRARATSTCREVGAGARGGVPDHRNAEGGALHLPDLRDRAADFEPLSRDRFLAGALLPAAWVLQAQRVRALVSRCARAELFRDVDVLLAPATPVRRARRSAANGSSSTAGACRRGRAWAC